MGRRDAWIRSHWNANEADQCAVEEPYHSARGKVGSSEVTIELPLAALLLDPDTAVSADDPSH